MRAALFFLSICAFAQNPGRLGSGSFSAGDGGGRVAIACGNRALVAMNRTSDTRAGVGVMDLSNPDFPSLVNLAYLSGAGETDAKAFAVSADCSTVYMGPLGTPEITVWDVSGVTGGSPPVLKSTLALGASGQPYWAQPYTDGVDNYVWVYVDNPPSSSRIYLVKVTNTSSPSIVTINGGTSYAATVNSFDVRGTVLYGCSETNSGTPTTITRINFTNLASFVTDTLTLNSGEENCKGAILNYPYFYASTDPTQRIVTVNVSTTPLTRLNAIALSNITQARHPAVLGNWLFVPSLLSPCIVDVLNISTPSTPSEYRALTFNSGENNCRFVSPGSAGRLYVPMNIDPMTLAWMALLGSKWLIN
jgi:hypothetical protein